MSDDMLSLIKKVDYSGVAGLALINFAWIGPFDADDERWQIGMKSVNNLRNVPWSRKVFSTCRVELELRELELRVRADEINLTHLSLLKSSWGTICIHA
jgi:hypothetical protein